MAERKMTQRTLDVLKALKTKLDGRQIDLSEGAGGGHARAGYHDAAGVEIEKNLTTGRLQLIGDLSEVKIIPPRQEVDRVDLGNRVKISYGEKDDDSEEYVYLGPVDAALGPEFDAPVLSSDSPLGKAIYQKSAGVVVSFAPDSKDKSKPKKEINVKITGIFPGKF